MQTHCFVKWVIIYSCALAWAFTPIVSNAQETAASFTGTTEHKFGPVVVRSSSDLAGRVDTKLPPPTATVDLFLQAGDKKEDPPALTAPIVTFNPSAGQTVKDGEVKTNDGLGNEAKAEGMMTGEPTDHGTNVVFLVKKAQGSVSATAAPPEAKGRRFALATAFVRDPVTFEIDPGGPGGVGIELGLSLDAGSSIFAQGNSFSSFVDSASTDLPGVGTLWTLSIGLSGLTGMLDVAFSSNPILGLSDSSITNLVLGAYGFDGNGYNLSGELDVFSAVLPIPDNVSMVSFADSDQWVAQAVPEPSTWVMLLIGFASLGFGTFRRTRGNAARVFIARADWVRGG